MKIDRVIDWVVFGLQVVVFLSIIWLIEEVNLLSPIEVIGFTMLVLGVMFHGWKGGK